MIALVGDTHLRDGLARLPEECARVLERADLVLHVGDFTARPVFAGLRSLAPLAAVHGNVDEPELRAELPERLVVEPEGMRIGLVHDPGPARGRHERLRSWFPDCEVVAYGHTHLPEVARSEGVWILNPGSPTQRRRSPAHTLIVLRGGRPELVELAR